MTLKKMSTMIGIDFGTTFSSISFIKTENERPHTIKVDGNKEIPTVISFTDRRILFGKEALDNADKYPIDTIFELKRMIGKNFNDKEFEEDKKYWTNKFINDNNQILIEVNFYGEKKAIPPEEVAAYFFDFLRNSTIKYFDKKKISYKKDGIEAVIAVPSSFNDIQRGNIRKSAELGGFNITKIIDETTASGFLHNSYMSSNNSLYFDMGGGFLELSYIENHHGSGKVKIKKESQQLGGRSFDIQILQYCVNKIKEEKNINLLDDNILYKRPLLALKRECVKAKEFLSPQNPIYTIGVFNLLKDYHFHSTITYEDLNSMINIQKEKCLSLIKESKNRYDEVILVGKSCKSSIIREMINSAFDQRIMIYSPYINDNIVSNGAAKSFDEYLKIKDKKYSIDKNKFDINTELLNSTTARISTFHEMEEKYMEILSTIKNMKKNADGNIIGHNSSTSRRKSMEIVEVLENVTSLDYTLDEILKILNEKSEILEEVTLYT